MNKFPGIVGRVGIGRKIVLNDEQKEWLERWYPVIENHRILKAIGIGHTSLNALAKEMRLSKSTEGMKAITKRSRKKAAMTNERNGCYDRKRGHPVSAATIEGRNRRFLLERAGLVENAQLRIKREEPEKYKKWIQNRSKERKESIRKEKMRLVYGLGRKTKLKPVVLCPYTMSQKAHRYNAIKRGYLLDYDCSEGQPGRYVIYYDEHTVRSQKFEENCIKDGFVFKPDV